MQAWIVSDIHWSSKEFLFRDPLDVPKADICICGGDISGSIHESINYIKHRISPHMPVVLTLGNHDYYGSSIDYALSQALKAVEGTNIHLLENRCVEFEGCRFVGATLWTDYAVAVGGDEHIPPEERRAFAMGVVPAQIADFYNIFRSDERRSSENGMLTAHEIIQRHKESRSFIDQALDRPFEGPSIVVTHHAPHVASFSQRFYGDATNATFASDLSELIHRRRPNFWIHGHIHAGRDYVIDSTRIICNPRGYGNEADITGFNPNLVISL